MEKEFKQNGLASFLGLNVGASKAVTLKFKISYSEIVTSINLLQGLNTDITIQAKVGSAKPIDLGMFTIGNVSFDRDGNATVQFKALVDNVNLDKIVTIVDEEQVKLRFLAVLELPDSTENGGN